MNIINHRQVLEPIKSKSSQIQYKRYFDIKEYTQQSNKMIDVAQCQTFLTHLKLARSTPRPNC